MDVANLFLKLQDRLSIDELEDLYNRLGDRYDFQKYVEHDIDVTKAICEMNERWKDIMKPIIKKVIFNPPATIILWNDGSKSVVKCQNGEPFDAEKGFALAYLKKLLGNDNTFNKEINKWVCTDD